MTISPAPVSGSIILQTTARWFLPVLLGLSIYFLMRGHNSPGGGFVGGLVAALGFSLVSLTLGIKEARKKLIVAPHVLLGMGLLVAIVSGIPGLLQGESFMKAQWFEIPLLILPAWKTGTVFLFDCGVYLVVLGMVTLVVFSGLEDQDR